jgi:hypothetical protein
MNDTPKFTSHWEIIKKACDLAQSEEFYGELRFIFQRGKLVRFDIYRQNKIDSDSDLDDKFRVFPLA